MLPSSMTSNHVWGSIALMLASSAGCSGNASGSGGSGATGSGTGSSPAGVTSSSTGTPGATSSSATSGGGGSIATKRPYPDTSATIGILADELPNGMSGAQRQFVVDHFVGTEKMVLSESQPLRALKPDFLVLHYHLSIWQSAPGVDFIIDGQTWGNDYPQVDTHETWFWHNASAQRVASTADGKLLMNLGDSDWQAYWQSSLEAQVAAGDYDGIFFDSASPALLQGETNNEPRLSGTGAKDTAITELGGKTYIQAWEAWIQPLNDALAAKGIPLIPNTGAFVTGWDNTDYTLTAGIFSEGFADPNFAESDWKASTNELLKLSAADKIMILQNYLSGPDDLAHRRYYLANYLLVKGKRTYLDYFAAGPLEWYPEWGLDLGAPMSTATTATDLATGGIYRRDFANGVVLVNPTDTPVTAPLGATLHRVEPQGGGAVLADGVAPGTLGQTDMSSILVAAHSAEILLK